MVNFENHIIRISYTKKAAMDFSLDWFARHGATITKIEGLRLEARWSTPEVFHREMAKDDDYVREGDEYHLKA